MLRKLAVSAAALAAMGFAGSASAQQINPQQYNVNVNIEVAEEVSMWAGHENVGLVLDGADANNFKASESSISRINNVAADINVAVNGNFPTPTVAGGGILFYIFNNVDAATAKANTLLNAYNPAGALVWTDANENTSQLFASNQPVATSIATQLVTYAAATPGELPVPQTLDLDVLWTISKHN